MRKKKAKPPELPCPQRSFHRARTFVEVGRAVWLGTCECGATTEIDSYHQPLQFIWEK